MVKNFFNAPTEASRIKVEIVVEYFRYWASVIDVMQQKFPARSEHRMAYIDLYAGKGYYDEGTPSIPIRILEHAIQTESLQKKLVTYFNEGDITNAEALRTNIGNLEGATNLHYKPVVDCDQVNEEVAKYYEQRTLIPSLIFVDPFGYSGLSAKLITAVLKDWGSDCIFFFNYARVNAAINNDLVRTHVDAIFGADKINELRAVLPSLQPMERERRVMHELNRVLFQSQIRFTRTFRFRRVKKEETSHYLVFATKHWKPYKTMSDIMAKHSSIDIDGFYSFEYNPIAKEKESLALRLFKPFDMLKHEIKSQFRGGRSLTVVEMFLEHSPGTTYILKNYKVVLNSLYTEGALEILSLKKPRGRTFADDIEFAVR